jgi:superoxide dismutase, Fe-Mn family
MTDELSPLSRRGFVGTALACAVATDLFSRSARADEPKPQAAPLAPKPAAPLAPKPAAPPAEPLVLAPLPFADNALEPYITATTLSFHYGKHHKAYVDKTNTLAAEAKLAGKPLLDIMKRSQKNPALKKLHNNAAQAYNHAFYWQSMKPKGGGEPSGDLKARIEKDFGSYTAFRDLFIQTGVDHFSNGWVWLVLDGKKLKVVDSHDAESPVLRGKKPLLVSDVWEHAYYLDYKNVRKDYLTAFVDHLLNWDFVAQNLAG